MRARITLLVCFLAGCDALFGLVEVPYDAQSHGGDAAVGDANGSSDAASMGDGPRTLPDAAACSATGQGTYPVIADTELVSTFPTRVFGSYDTAGVNGTFGTTVLLRFNLPFGVPYDHYQTMSLTLPFPAGGAKACDTNTGMTCASCLVSEQAGGLRVYPATSAWTEADATWDSATNVTTWSGPGATGPSDRGTVYASGVHTVGQDTIVDLGGAFLPQALMWATGGTNGGGQLTLEIVANDANIVEAIQSKENTCGTSATASLSFSYCQ